MHTTSYLINHGPSSPLNFKIMEEVWCGKEVTLSHLHVSDGMSYVHISDHVRDKPDAVTEMHFH